MKSLQFNGNSYLNKYLFNKYLMMPINPISIGTDIKIIDFSLLASLMTFKAFNSSPTCSIVSKHEIIL